MYMYTIYSRIDLVERTSNMTILPKIVLAGQFSGRVGLTGQLKIWQNRTIHFLTQDYLFSVKVVLTGQSDFPNFPTGQIPCTFFKEP